MNEDTAKIEAELAEERMRLRENVEELTDRLNPSRLMHDAKRAAINAPKKLASELGTYVRDNPVPAVLAGLGLYLLLRSGRSEHRDGFDEYGYDRLPSDYEFDAHSAWESYQEASWACVRGADESDADYQRRLTRERARSLGIDALDDEDETSFRARVEQAAEKTKRFAMTARDKLKRATRSGARALGGAASKAASAIKSGAGAAAGAVKSGAGAAASAVKTGAGAASGFVGSAKDRAEHFYEERPLASGVIGLAAGAVVGALLPLSRVEKQRLQGVVDGGLNRGAETAKNAASAVSAFADDVTSSTARH